MKSLKHFILSIICFISLSGGISILRVVLSILGSSKSSDCFEVDTILIGISCVIVRELILDEIECKSNSTVKHVDFRFVKKKNN